jgi:hypothetical protein
LHLHTNAAWVAEKKDAEAAAAKAEAKVKAEADAAANSGKDGDGGGGNKRAGNATVALPLPAADRTAAPEWVWRMGGLAVVPVLLVWLATGIERPRWVGG